VPYDAQVTTPQTGCMISCSGNEEIAVKYKVVQSMMMHECLPRECGRLMHSAVQPPFKSTVYHLI
jgi:hypothetical protein